MARVLLIVLAIGAVLWALIQSKSVGARTKARLIMATAFFGTCALFGINPFKSCDGQSRSESIENQVNAAFDRIPEIEAALKQRRRVVAEIRDALNVQGEVPETWTEPRRDGESEDILARRQAFDGRVVLIQGPGEPLAARWQFALRGLDRLRFRGANRQREHRDEDRIRDLITKDLPPEFTLHPEHRDVIAQERDTRPPVLQILVGPETADLMAGVKIHRLLFGRLDPEPGYPSIRWVVCRPEREVSHFFSAPDGAYFGTVKVGRERIAAWLKEERGMLGGGPAGKTWLPQLVPER